MLLANMVKNIRTRLDEVSTSGSLYTDSEIYLALSEAQEMLYSLINIKYIDDLIVSAELSVATTGVSDYNVPTSYLRYVSAEVNSYQVDMIQTNKSTLRRDGNEYLKPSATEPIGYILTNGTHKTIYIKPADASDPKLTLWYIPEPTPITSSSAEPVLPIQTHAALIQYAYAALLRKKELYQQAASEFNIFMNLVKALI